MYSNYTDELRAPPRAGGGGPSGVAADEVAKRVKDPLLKTVDWAKNRPPKEKAMLAGGAAVLVRVGLALLDIYSRALAASADGADAQAALGAMAPACFDGSRLVDTAWAGYGPRVVAAGEVARLRAAAGVEAGRGG